MPEPTAKILPIYFVPDESGSMHGVVSELMTGLRSLHDAIQENSMAAAMIRFSIIGFSDGIYEHLRLGNLLELEAMPQLGAYNGTSYEAIFQDLRPRIEQDVKQLRSGGGLVHRPVIFFLSDGAPNPPADRWRDALKDLSGEGFKYHPRILAFGIGSAIPEVIREVASEPRYAFQAAKGADIGAALLEFFNQFTKSLIYTSRAMAQGKNELVFEKPEGFVSLDIDPLPPN